MSTRPIPTISRVLPDGTLIELVYREDEETTSFAIRSGDGTVRTEPEFAPASGESLVPYSAANNLIATGCVLFPSDVTPFADKATLLEDVRAFIRRYVDLSPLYEDIAAHYVLLTWIGDAFNEAPYLRFQGAFGSGKTRALLVVGSICYKPFFASGASTVSPIFHILDTIGGTLVLDEADLRFSDATADIAKILNNGSTKGLPVLRTMTNKDRELNPRAFRVFGSKLIAMRGWFDDVALESRLITATTSQRTIRKDIPLSLPDAMKVEALALRNRLLGWRFAMRDEVAIDLKRAFPELSARGNQMVLPLLAIIDDNNLRRAIAEELSAAEEVAAAGRTVAPEVRMVGILAAMICTAVAAHIPLSAATEAYNEAQTGSSAPPLSVKSAGWLVRHKLGIRTVKTRGVYVIPSSEWDRIASLAKRHGVDADATVPGTSAMDENAGGHGLYAPGA